MAAQPFYGVVTLTNADTNYNLYSLISAIKSTAARNCAQLELLAPLANTNNVAVGPGSMAALTDGDQMIAGDSRNFSGGGGANPVSVTEIFVRSDGAGQKLAVRVRTS
jgi:hypothetical protein